MDEIDECIRMNDTYLESLKILERVKRDYPKYYFLEYDYQQKRIKYSEAYFSGSPEYVGPSVTEYMLTRSKNVIPLMFGFYIIYQMKLSNCGNDCQEEELD